MFAAHKGAEGAELLGGTESSCSNPLGSLLAYLFYSLWTLLGDLLEVATQTDGIEEAGQ
jgi:hypothetical protein